jgi:hypothetical protein
MKKTRKEYFDNMWHENWFCEPYGLRGGTLSFSSDNIQSLFRLSYMAIDGMEDALTMPIRNSR